MWKKEKNHQGRRGATLDTNKDNKQQNFRVRFSFDEDKSPKPAENAGRAD